MHMDTFSYSRACDRDSYSRFRNGVGSRSGSRPRLEGTHRAERVRGPSQSLATQDSAQIL